MKIIVILLRFDTVGNADSTCDPNSTSRVDNYTMPLGLAYIATYLKKHGKDVTVLNLNNKIGTIDDTLYREMQYEKYDVAILGGLSMYYPHLRNIITGVRKYSPSTKVVLGGGIFTAQPTTMFNLLEPDYGVVGEGERTVLELVQCLETNGNPFNVAGLVYKKDSYLQFTIEREPILDLDALPFPDYEPFGFRQMLDRNKLPDIGWAYDIVDEPRPYPILASRSCPFNCTFCFHPLGKRYRQRSIDNIMEEIKLNVTKYNINIINLYDELFSNDRNRVLEFCTKFKAYSETLPNKLWFSCNCRVDTTTGEMLVAMKDAGAYLLSFGLESYSPTVLKSMKKHTTPEQITRVVHLLRETGIGLLGGFIFGDIAETKETATETLNFIKKNRKLLGAGVSFVFIIPFQGTPLYKQCVYYGKIPSETAFIEDRARNWFKYLEPMNMTSLSTKEFEELKEEVFKLHTVSDVYTVPKKEWVSFGDFPPLYKHTILVRCPWCGEFSMLKNIPSPKGFETRNVGCRVCHYRFHIVSRWYPIKKFIIRAFGFKFVYWLRTKIGR